MLDFHYPNWDGPAEGRTFEMTTPSGQAISIGAEYDNLGQFVDALMAGGVSQEDIFATVLPMLPLGTATGE